jgi:hypothetical protein
MSERWAVITRFPDYAVSDLGRVKSLARVVQRLNRWGTVSRHSVRERVLKLGKRSGYLLASIHVSDYQTTIYVHQEVMRAFGSPCPFPGAFVRHLNDDRADSRLDNLAWGSQADNMADAIRNGRELGGYRPKGFRL